MSTAVLMVVWLVAAPVQGAEFKGGLLTPSRMAPDFALTTQDGKDLRLSGLRGHVVAISFGYTFCPDVCPMTLAELTQVRGRLGTDARRFEALFITVDPERDTPPRLREYVNAFSRGFTALTGSAGRLADVRKAYGVVAEKRVVPGTAAAYLIDHSSFVYIVDPAGQLRLMFPFGMSIDDMVHDIRLLMQR